jgi:3-hydroxyacyl-CoA dehydrogenase
LRGVAQLFAQAGYSVRLQVRSVRSDGFDAEEQNDALRVGWKASHRDRLDRHHGAAIAQGGHPVRLQALKKEMLEAALRRSG